MRNIIVETIEPQETEIETFITKLNAKELTLLLDLGMDIHDLLIRSKTEFLSPGGAQYRVYLCELGSWVPHEVKGVA